MFDCHSCCHQLTDSWQIQIFKGEQPDFPRFLTNDNGFWIAEERSTAGFPETADRHHIIIIIIISSAMVIFSLLYSALHCTAVKSLANWVSASHYAKQRREVLPDFLRLRQRPKILNETSSRTFFGTKFSPRPDFLRVQGGVATSLSSPSSLLKF